MIRLIFCIWDKKAEAFTSDPWFLPTKGMAIRAFSDLIKARDNDVAKHPEDYALFHLGDFNPTNGALTSADEPSRSMVHLINAIDLVEKN